MSTLLLVPEPEVEPDSEDQRPGEPMGSGFRFRRARDVPDVQLSDEARQRVLRKMESVDEARLKAAKEGHTAYVG